MSCLMCNACNIGDLKRINLLIDLGYSGGCCPTIAARKGYMHILKYMHDKGELPISNDIIAGAALNNKSNIVKFLVNRGHDKEVALIYASGGGHLNLVKYLISKAAKIREEALFRATIGGHFRIVKYLTEKEDFGCKQLDRSLLKSVDFGYTEITLFLASHYDCENIKLLKKCNPNLRNIIKKRPKSARK